MKLSIHHLFFFAAMFLLPGMLHAQAQATPAPVADTARARQDSIITTWLENLYVEGVSVQGDSIIISPETQMLLSDEKLRQIAYPKTYEWNAVVEFIKKQQLKMAFWYMINLYMTDEKSKQAAVKSLLVYDRFLKMDKVLTSTFYTFIFADPQVGTITNGHQSVTAPQVMDKKLNALKEILYYLNKYKPEEKKGTHDKH